MDKELRCSRLSASVNHPPWPKGAGRAPTWAPLNYIRILRKGALTRGFLQDTASNALVTTSEMKIPRVMFLDLEAHRMPVIPGHQIVGRVDETGDGVMRLRVRQRIVIAWLQHVDGTCQFCRRGRENLCRDSRYTGYDVDGGYAEYAISRRTSLTSCPSTSMTNTSRRYCALG